MTTQARRGVPTFGDLKPYLDREVAAAEELRMKIHGSPRLSGDEVDTRDLVLREFERLQEHVTVEVQHLADTGAVVSLSQFGSRSAPVALRAELDGLAVTETTGVSWASEVPGVMHACGHDVHLAGLVCAAKVLANFGMPAPLQLILQPREENAPSGAIDVLAQCPDLSRARAIVAAHVQPALASGEIACVDGVVNASNDEFEITIEGRGGHAAYPHTSDDALYAAAQVVVALGSATARLLDPTSTGVVSVTRFAAGTGTNIIPDVATFEGTMRAYAGPDRAVLLEHITEVAHSFAAAFGCRATVTLRGGEPPLLNDPALALRTAAVLADAGVSVNTTLRSAGADDFAYYAAEAPSLMMFVGIAADPKIEHEQQLHRSNFLPAASAVRAVATALLAGYLGGLEGGF